VLRKPEHPHASSRPHVRRRRQADELLLDRFGLHALARRAAFTET
jgi:hypothetical protein